jgi:hypothetical protein
MSDYNFAQQPIIIKKYSSTPDDIGMPDFQNNHPDGYSFDK